METGPLFRNRLTSALVLAAVPLAFLIAVTAFQLGVNVPGAAQARSATMQSVRLIRAAAAVDAAVQDAERGQRGFLITARDAYLQPYDQAAQRLPRLMAALQAASSDSAGQPARVLALQSHITTKMNEMGSTVVAMRQLGFAGAKAIVDTDVGRQTMERIRADLTAITDAADASLVQRIEAEDRAQQRVTVTFVVGSLIAGISLLASAALIGRAYHRAALSERVLQVTLDSVREGVGAFDRRGRLQAWNAPFGAMLQPPEPLRRGMRLPVADATAEGGLRARIDELEHTIRRTGRSTLIEHDTTAAVHELFVSPTGDDGFIVTILEITERRRAEEALRQAQTLEALGKMTGGIAHDFNNLLTIIIGSLSTLRAVVRDNPKASERLEMVGVAADRGARLTRQLLAFARRQPLEPEVINLAQMVQETLPLIKRAVGETIAVECVTASGLWNTTVDASQFQAAAINLAINGGDAMPDGGKLTIELSNAAIEDSYAARHAEVSPGQYVLFAISDTGFGMDAATLSRAVEPFFTTKPVGKGTGLGLPQVFGFVKQSGGHLKIYSEIGEGTTVKLYLPRGHGAQAAQPVRPAGAALTGTETILLVDDDEIVRLTVASMLDDLGYRVLTAASGAEAARLLEQGLAVDLLFTDVVMPGELGGRQLADRARAIRPGLKVLFTSGYTENAIVHNGRLDPGVELLSKPYDWEALAAKVRRALGR